MRLALGGTHFTGDTVNRRQLELQIRAVVITLRYEQRRQDPATMAVFRERARVILDGIAGDVAGHPELQAAFDRAMAQVQPKGSGERLDDTG